MSEEQPLTRNQAVEEALKQIDGPMAVDEFCQRVLTLWPSKAKNPLSAVRSHLREQHAGKTLVFLDAKTIVPLRIAMRSMRFRTVLSRSEVKRGLLQIHPAFDFFLRRELDPSSVQLLDANGHRLPFQVSTIPVQADSFFAMLALDNAAFDLGQWFHAQGVGRNDSILVTVEDWMAGHFRLEYEASKRRRTPEIEQKDRELAGLLFDMLEQARNELLYAHVAVPTAYARLSDPRGYPGSHWLDVVSRDARMQFDGWAIRYGDWSSPFDLLHGHEEPVPTAEFSPDQRQQVYRFKAALWYRPGLWRTVEIQGEQTLADFDSILRAAFNHDPSDHLGGFWKLTRRGKGKRVREVDLGNVDPVGGGDGAAVPVAGLELAPGDELKYVYDFGDWIQHRLTLQEIVEPEAKAKYPRIVAQNKPQYKNCESCQAKGRTTRATWICLECSDREQREVLLCEKCLGKKHEDHYAEEIVY
jgi:hypothetical protein